MESHCLKSDVISPKQSLAGSSGGGGARKDPCTEGTGSWGVSGSVSHSQQVWHELGKVFPAGPGRSPRLELPQPLPNTHPKAPGCALPYPCHFPAGFASPPSSTPLRPAALGAPLTQVGPAGLSAPLVRDPPHPGDPPSQPRCWEPGRGSSCSAGTHGKALGASRGVTGQKTPSLAALPQSSSSSFWN